VVGFPKGARAFASSLSVAVNTWGKFASGKAARPSPAPETQEFFTSPEEACAALLPATLFSFFRSQNDQRSDPFGTIRLKVPG